MSIHSHSGKVFISESDRQCCYHNVPCVPLFRSSEAIASSALNTLLR
jgi:hypothetical protein